jgi:hypothetical protein
MQILCANNTPWLKHTGLKRAFVSRILTQIKRNWRKMFFAKQSLQSQRNLDKLERLLGIASHTAEKNSMLCVSITLNYVATFKIITCRFQNYWISEICPSAGILNAIKHVSETESVLSSFEGRTPLLGRLE